MKFTDVKELEQSIKKRKEEALKYISHYLDKRASFVLYYNINLLNTTVNEGFGTIDGIISTSSPLRYDKIIDFPLYGLEINMSDRIDDDLGDTITIEGDCIILPNTIKPKVKDIFVVSQLGTQLIFEVTDIAETELDNSTYYKITYRLKYSNNDLFEVLETNQVINTFEFIFDNLGTDLSVIRLQNSSREEVSHVINILKDQYRELFYNKLFTSFIYRDKLGTIYYDVLLAKKMIETEMFTSNSFDSIYLTEQIPFDNKEDYRNNRLSIYNMILNEKDISAINMYIEPCVPMGSFSNTLKHIFRFVYDTEIRNLVPYDFIDTLKENIANDSNIFTKVIHNYMENNDLIIGSNDLNLLSNSILEYNLDSYITIPIIINILEQQFNN